MAGTRRGRDRQEESDAFEAANPFLTRVETTLEVVLVEDEDWGECSDDYEWGSDHYGWGSEYYDWEGPALIPTPHVEQDGEDVPFFVEDFYPMPVISFAEEIETPIGDLEAETDDDDADISMSEYGFGAYSEEDEESDMGAFALNGDEILEFDVENYYYEYLEPGMEMGGVSFEIDYMVLGGSGQVGVALFDYHGDKEDGPVEAMSGSLSEGDTGSLEVDALNGMLFEEAIIYVDGSIEVAITGISVVTNFDGGMFET